ncbi:BadF/BadG/BcrA/BcrD ATPase family protein [Nonomuraea sp. NPDC046570]|uniref:N-acetylglucosamine kinase n=1 Tax=Nonomuraea sp. NPDC046570 TaxID=3155255 RepID=UPI0033F55CC1
MLTVTVDGGQTGLRVALAENGRAGAAHEEPGLAYADGSPVEGVVSRVLSAWRALAPPGVRADTVSLGLTTLLGGPAADRELASRLFAGTGAGRVLIASDVVTAHAGALGGRPGVVLAAGTGAIALGVTPQGVTRQVDGWGHLYGDAGGGLWIGRHGLDAAVRGFDGRLPAGALTTRATEVFGDLGSLPERLYLAGDAVARVARFAVHVLELAHHDDHAARIVTTAGRELAATVTAAARDLSGPVPVSWTGRLLLDPALRAGFEASLAELLPQAEVREPEGDGLAGAAFLAAEPEFGLYRALVRVEER